MTSELDPEVADDLARRSASERDTGRRRQLVRELPEPVVEHWPCRTGCGAMVGQTAYGIAAWNEANEKLVAWRQKPLTKLEVMWCPACKARDEKRLADERAAALPPRQTEIPTTDNPDPIAAYKPTPRAKHMPRGGRKLR
jgi:hypothetical protein